MAKDVPVVLRTENFEIGGLSYTLQFPSLKESRAHADLLNRVMPLLAELEDHKYPCPLLALALNGGISGEETDRLVKLFGAKCTVDMGDDRVMQLSKDEAQNELWAESLDGQYEWLDRCLRTVYKGHMGKSKAVIARTAEIKADMAAKAKTAG